MYKLFYYYCLWDRSSRHMVVGFTTTCAIGAIITTRVVSSNSVR